MASLEVDQHWTFKLLAHGEEVYRVDVRPVGNHPNPANRPKGFPKNVREHVHEHVYIEGLGVECARPVDCPATFNHQDVLGVFCDGAGITFEVPYKAPPQVEFRMGYV